MITANETAFLGEGSVVSSGAVVVSPSGGVAGSSGLAVVFSEVSVPPSVVANAETDASVAKIIKMAQTKQSAVKMRLDISFSFQENISIYITL
jgi:hypothetical protein